MVLQLIVTGCGVVREAEITSEIAETCRQYPYELKGYEYEWNDETIAILGYAHGKERGCLARTKSYASKLEAIDPDMEVSTSPIPEILIEVCIN